MPVKFVFYVHHHGSGHLMRALAIASHLPVGTAAFLGSDLKPYQQLIPDHIACLHLPDDVPGPDDRFARTRELSFLHYAPLNIKGAAERAALITSFLSTHYPVLLMVDVSVEVSVLAALASIPSFVIRQNGDRNDTAHLNAYQSAQMLIAPSSRALMNPSQFDWVDQKTYFSGGFSRYTGTAGYAGKEVKNTVAVITGTGGTSITARFIEKLARQCPSKTFQVMGELAKSDKTAQPENVVFHGKVEDPAALLSTCEFVIGNAGHNTVMEMADLGKRFICIPEERPFEEQVHKADLLKKNNMAVVIEAGHIMHCDWNKLFEQALGLPADCWDGMINPNALAGIAALLCESYDTLFKS